MENIQSKKLPFLSIIIVGKNTQRTLPTVLSTIENQNYPKSKIEIIFVDGYSTDGTISIIKKSKLRIKVIKNAYTKDPEASRGVGLKAAKGEIIAYIDADNYLPHPEWIMKMITPFISHPEIVGAETWRYGYRKEDNYLNRYFALIGSADPVAQALGTADKVSYIAKKWDLYGKIMKHAKNYFIVQFEPEHYPTIGSNGFFARRKLLQKAQSDPKHYFHTDVPLDLAYMGYTQYAIVKDVIIHDTAQNFFQFLKKRERYMRLLYQKRAKDRRYLIFNYKKINDWYHLLLFIIFSLTFIQPLYISIKGYSKKADIAWFIHPIFSFSIMITYMIAIFRRHLEKIL